MCEGVRMLLCMRVLDHACVINAHSRGKTKLQTLPTDQFSRVAVANKVIIAKPKSPKYIGWDSEKKDTPRMAYIDTGVFG